MSKLSRKAIRAVNKYGQVNCEWAYAQNKQGEGPSNIGCALNLTVAQANAAIDAGKEISEAQ